MGAVVNEDAFCLKWNDFHTSVTSTFAELRNDSDLLDITVVCEGQALRAHKLVLSACSAVFRQLFRSPTLKPPHAEPVILMWDVKADDLKLLFNFMYEGQVNVHQERLNTFLGLAERLQVRGLTSTATEFGLQRAQQLNNTQRLHQQPTTINQQQLQQQMRTGGPVGRVRVPSPLPMMVGSSQGASSNKRPRSTVSSEDMDNAESGSEGANDPSGGIKQELKVEYASGEGGPTTVVPSTAVHAPNNYAQFNQFYHEGASATTVAVAAAAAAAAANSADHPHPAVNNQFATAETQPMAGDYAMQHGIMDQGHHKGGVVVLGSPTAAASPLAVVAAPSTSNSANGGGSNTATRSSSGTSPSSQNNGGVCHHCHKSFRQLRSHIQDVHCPTPTPCPLCGKVFTSKHKMFGHKYRSCPNRTKNLVRHLQDLDGGSGSGSPGGGQQASAHAPAGLQTPHPPSTHPQFQ